jgi:metal-dependent amidase/aminoacylase/carboxypeptidase family protein
VVHGAVGHAHVFEAARALFGTALLADSPAATSEDFAVMLEEAPGAYVWLGQGGDALMAVLVDSRLTARHVLS